MQSEHIREEERRKTTVTYHFGDNTSGSEIQVLTVASMMFRIVFWDVLPCKMIVDRRFRGAYCLQQGLSDLKRRSTIILHGSTSQKTILNNTSGRFVYHGYSLKKVLIT
jgi:hypothetical protein